MKIKSQDKNSRSETFRARLSGLLKDRKISQRQFATAVGISPGTVSNYISGERALPRAEELLAMARHLGVSVEWLLGEGKQSGSTANARPVPSLKAQPSKAKLRVAVRQIKRQVARLEELLGD